MAIPWPPKLPRGFPLTVTDRGYVARIGKRPRWICGRRTPAEALKVYHRKAAAIVGGQAAIPERAKPPARPTLGYILRRWIIDRKADAARGELSPSAIKQYRLSAKRIDATAGHYLVDDLTPDHSRAIYDRLAAHGIDFAKRAIGHLRAACQHASDMGWCRPPRLGRAVVAKLASRPAPAMRWRLYTAYEIGAIMRALDEDIDRNDARTRSSRVQLRAMVLLALNGGYGAQELSDLPRSAVDLTRGVIDFARAKTDGEHVVPLWTETIAALRPVLDQRPNDVLLFRTRQGTPWCRHQPRFKSGRAVDSVHVDNVNNQFTYLVKRLGLKIQGQGFYKLRHLANTTADAAGDPHATFTLFGHALPGSKGHYVRVGEDRVRQVVEYMRRHILLVPVVLSTPAGLPPAVP